jgi:galactose mutarotase-like enzyme
LLPVFPYQSKHVVITSDGNYDSLFQGGTHLRLHSKQGFNV